ncbi:glycosyltransferase family 2 protein [Spirosoma foliorum]|uniref:Glycosyltransferase n=1 Tax=Spirosoma foliorum TaxID=2710596 RepID=A0A7G5H2E5_9BACT|nr:glycosyltransferase family 2 protein [Spirosoma foliorum]QMW05287.1 glycosyltransferase [Spirosoma foliorum]
MLDINQPVSNRPSSSILIAARNEEAAIQECLSAIDQLKFSPGTVEVVIGDDQSTDQTAERTTQFIDNHPDFRLISITQTVPGLAGKANVLAQLVRQTQGEILFFTDADTQVPPSWLAEMSRQFNGNVGVVTGVTLPEGPRLFHKLQKIDWLYNLTLTHLVSSVGIPITAMGNNMAVSRQAYDAVGGYESIPFSVTEDYALFEAIIRQGYGFRNLLDERVLAHTKPVETVSAFLQQRKRWMRGATSLPIWMVSLLYLQYLAAPLLVGLAFVAPVLALGLYLVKLFIQTMVLSFGLSRLKQTKLWPYALLFEIYQLIVGPISVVFYLLPTTVEWKGRTYN